MEKLYDGGYVLTSRIDTFSKNKEKLLNKKNKDIVYKKGYVPQEGNLDNSQNIKELMFNYPIPNVLNYGAIKLITFNGKKINKNIAMILYNNKSPIYISISSTYYSMDGEYRHNMIPYGYYLKMIKTHKLMLNKVLDKLLKNKMPIKMTNYNTEIDLYIVLAIFYMKNYGKEYFEFKTHKLIQQSDMYEEKDSKWFTDDQNKQIIFLNTIFNYYITTNYDKTKTWVGKIALNQIFQKPRVGFKIVPLYINATDNPADIKQEPWLELYMSTLVNNLIVNGVCAGAPLTFNWGFLNVKNYKKLYDLDVTYLKYEHSERSKEIEKLLSKARQMSYIDNTDVYINYDFKVLRKQINQTIKLSEETLHISDKALVIFNEYKNETLNTIFNKTTTGSFVKKLGEEMFFRENYIFKVIYDLYALNIYGIIHGDLHLNNITLKYNKHVKQYDLYIVSKDGPMEEIDISGQKIKVPKEKDYYYVRKDIIEPNIIDFSRSIVSEKIINDYSDDEMERDTLLSMQRNRINSVLKHMMPNFYEKNANRIQTLLFDDYKQMFNIAAATDLYRFSKLLMSKYTSTFDVSENETFKKLNFIKNFTEDYINELDGRENPNYLLIKTFKFDEPEHIVTDIYYTHNPILYNMDSYENLPDMCKIIDFDEVHPEDVRDKHKLKDNEFIGYEKEYVRKKEDIDFENVFDKTL